MIKLVFADDHHIILHGLKQILHTAEDISLVGECTCGLSALEAIRQQTPDVALLDISMPGLDGIALTEHLRREASTTRVILLTMHDTPEIIGRALASGVRGYVVKSTPPEELLVAIRTVALGGAYFSPDITYLHGTLTNRQLTRREIEILGLIADGHSNRQIAERLGLSIKTVDTHRTNMMYKLDAHNAADLVRHAIKAGIRSA